MCGHSLAFGTQQLCADVWACLSAHNSQCCASTRHIKSLRLMATVLVSAASHPLRNAARRALRHAHLL